MTTKTRPHGDPKCPCIDCYTWDACARLAPLTRCAETHARRTDWPCLHGFTWWCPSFGIPLGAYP